MASLRGADISDGIQVRLKLSAVDILRLTDNIIATSTSVHDAVAAVPLDQVIPLPTSLLFCCLELMLMQHETVPFLRHR